MGDVSARARAENSMDKHRTVLMADATTEMARSNRKCRVEQNASSEGLDFGGIGRSKFGCFTAYMEFLLRDNCQAIEALKRL